MPSAKTSVETTRDCLDVIDRPNPEFNAFITVIAEQPLAEAEAIAARTLIPALAARTVSPRAEAVVARAGIR